MAGCVPGPPSGHPLQRPSCAAIRPSPCLSSGSLSDNRCRTRSRDAQNVVSSVRASHTTRFMSITWKDSKSPDDELGWVSFPSVLRVWNAPVRSWSRPVRSAGHVARPVEAADLEFRANPLNRRSGQNFAPSAERSLAGLRRVGSTAYFAIPWALTLRMPTGPRQSYLTGTSPMPWMPG